MLLQEFSVEQLMYGNLLVDRSPASSLIACSSEKLSQTCGHNEKCKMLIDCRASRQGYARELLLSVSNYCSSFRSDLLQTAADTSVLWTNLGSFPDFRALSFKFLIFPRTCSSAQLLAPVWDGSAWVL